MDAYEEAGGSFFSFLAPVASPLVLSNRRTPCEFREGEPCTGQQHLFVGTLS
jgi:hypothetical protein